MQQEYNDLVVVAAVTMLLEHVRAGKLPSECTLCTLKSVPEKST